MTSQSRRTFLRGAAGLAGLRLCGTGALSGLCFFAAEAATKPRSENVTPIPYGAAVRADTLASDAAYRDAVIARCKQIVPESELKWDELRPTRGEYRFERADALAAFAREHGLGLRGHTLAWYGALPEWTKGIDSRAEAERELVNHIEKVVSRYRGAIASWDVVNEPLLDWPKPKATLRDFVWSKWLGAEYMPIAFRAAAAADPNAQLVLNEYDIEYVGPRYQAKRDALVALVRSLRDRNVPIHAVGLQAHLLADQTIDRAALRACLKQIVDLGLDIIVTELDVIDLALPADTASRDRLVAQKAAEFLGVVGEVRRPTAILTWGLSDRYTWVPTFYKRPDGLPNRPLPLDADYRPKPLAAVIARFSAAAQKG